MLFIAWKMLTGDRLKYASMILGVAFATLLMAQQSAIYSGLAYSTGSAIRDFSGDADLWVMDKAVNSPDDQKPMRTAVTDIVRGMEGVRWGVPIIKGGATMRLPDGTQQRPIIIGLDDSTLRGGPSRMLSGALEDLRQDGGIIIDAAQAKTFFQFTDATGNKRPLAVGDRLVINDAAAVVVGVCKLSSSLTPSPTVFTAASRARLYTPPEARQLAFVLVKASTDTPAGPRARTPPEPQAKAHDGARAPAEPEGQPHGALARLQARIAEREDLIARTPAEFIQRTEDYLNETTGILVSFAIVIGLGLLIGLIIVGQTFFNFIVDNTRYFAAFKAIGMTDRMIAGVVLAQIGVVAVTGYWFGMAAASGFGLALDAAGADFPFRMTPAIPIGTAVGIALVAIAAGSLGLWRVIRLEPGVVFKT